MLAHVEQLCPCGQIVAHEVVYWLGQQRLPTMPRRQHSRRAVEWLAEVVAVPCLDHARVQGHTHFHRARLFAPRLSLNSALSGQGGPDSIRGSGEGHAKGVAHHLEDITTMC